MLLVAVSGGIDSMCLAEKVRLEGWRTMPTTMPKRSS